MTFFSFAFIFRRDPNPRAPDQPGTIKYSDLCPKMNRNTYMTNKNEEKKKSLFGKSLL